VGRYKRLEETSKSLVLKKEAVRSSETLVCTCKPTRHHKPEDQHRRLHGRDIKSHTENNDMRGNSVNDAKWKG
jgi:hypothetical protein